jgi:hypothetical protein
MATPNEFVRIADRFGRHLIGRQVGSEIRRQFFGGAPETWPRKLNFEGVEQATESCIDEIFGELVKRHGPEALCGIEIVGANPSVDETVAFVRETLSDPPVALNTKAVIALLATNVRHRVSDRRQGLRQSRKKK